MLQARDGIAEIFPHRILEAALTAEHANCTWLRDMSVSSHALEMVYDTQGDPHRTERLILAKQLNVVREMLGTLDTLTIAGQRHAMEKVVAFVDTRTRGITARIGDRNRTTLLDLLTKLRKESERLVPDLVTFTHHAASVITLLGTLRLLAERSST